MEIKKNAEEGAENSNGDKFAFLVHPRDVKDIKTNYPYLGWVPSIVLELLMVFLRPKKLTVINGLKNTENINVEGYLVAVFLTARFMLLLPKFFVAWRIAQAVKLSKSMGCSIVGLGMFTSPLTNGGLDLIGKYEIGITNGNALTASISLSGVNELANLKKIDIKDSTIAIIGATGSVGSAITLGMSLQNPKKLILIGRTPKNLEALKNEISRGVQNKNVVASTDINEVKDADIIVTATASNKALLKSKHLKHGAAVYDVAQPQNVAEEVRENRKDVLVVEGGLVEGPKGVSYNFDIGLRPGTYFACMVETMVLALEGIRDDFSVGKASFENVLKIKELAEKNNFKLAKLRDWSSVIG